MSQITKEALLERGFTYHESCMSFYTTLRDKISNKVEIEVTPHKKDFKVHIGAPYCDWYEANCKTLEDLDSLIKLFQ